MPVLILTKEVILRTNEIITKIIELVVLVIVSVVSYYVIPYLKNKLGVAKYEDVTKWIEKAVRAAEQIYTPAEWAEKKVFVTDFVSSWISNNTKFQITPAELDILIEGAVNEVKKANSEVK